MTRYGHSTGTVEPESRNGGGSEMRSRGGRPLARLLSYNAAAAYLSLSYWTVREMVLRGDVPHVRCGRRVLVDRRDLDDWIDRSKETGV